LVINDKKTCDIEDTKFFLDRVRVNMNYSIYIDCEVFKDLSKSQGPEIIQTCRSHFLDEVDKELSHVSLSSDDEDPNNGDPATKNQGNRDAEKQKERKLIFAFLRQCTYEDRPEKPQDESKPENQSKMFQFLKIPYVDKLMKKAGIMSDMQAAFIETNSDEYVKDVTEKAKEVKNSFLGADKKETIADMSFVELKATTKTRDDPPTNFAVNNSNKYKEFEDMLRKNLQNKKTFLAEDMESFSSDNDKEQDLRGGNFVMEQNFMSFLKYLGIKSKRVCDKMGRVMRKKKENKVPPSN